MGRGIKVKGEQIQEFEEHITSIVQCLCKYSEGVERDRVLNKFKQKDYEKLGRLIELHIKYQELVQKDEERLI
jgi:hypothetical protein